MSYVYDVLVNLNEEMYDFYDWEDNDDFSHVRRTPIFKVSREKFNEIFNFKVKFDSEFLLSIKEKTQVFSSRNIEVISYAAIFSDGKNALMVELSEDGVIRRRSKFLINEEMEILEIANSMKISDISYSVVSNKLKKNLMIRSEKKIIEEICNELETLKEDSKRIDYLYYEWFMDEDGEDKYNKLYKSIRKSFTNKHEDFLELLHLLTIKK